MNNDSNEPDTSVYLTEVAERVSEYAKARKFATEMVHKENIRDPDTIIDMAVMAVLWVAQKRGEVLSDEDLSIIFGGSGTTVENSKTYILDKSYKNLSLEGLLKLIASS